MRKKSVSIEFTGIAGVGKSTLIKEIMSLLEKENIPFNDLTTFRGRKISLRNIQPFLKALHLASLVGPTSIFGFKKILKQLTVHQALFTQKNYNKLINIYDEGIFHKARALRRYSKEKSTIHMLTKFHKYIDLPEILIVLEAEPQVIYKRRKKRNRKHDVFSLESIQKDVKDNDFNNALNIILNKPDFKRELKVIRLDHNREEDISKNACQIVKILKEKL